MWIAVILSIFLSLTSGFATYSFLPIFSLVFENKEAPVISTGNSESVAESQMSWQVWSTKIGESANLLLFRVAGEGTVMTKLGRLVIFVSVLTAISAGLSLLVDYLFIVVQAAGVRRLREVSFARIASLPMSYFNKQKTGYLISRVENDIGGAISMVAKSLSDTILYGFMIITYLALLLFVNAQLVFVLLPILLAIGIFAVVMGRWIKRTRKKILELQSATVAVLQEFLSGIRVVKLFVAESYEQLRWKKYAARGYRLEIVGSLNKILPSRLTEMLVVLVTAVVLLAGGWLITQQRATVAEFLVFFILLIRFQKPVSGLVNIWWNIQNGLAFAERVTILLQEPAEVQGGHTALPKKQQEIQFEKVSFKYENELILSDVSFNLPAGKMIGLVGPSGAGKSSIVDILLRLYDPIEGKITFNGIDIRNFPLRQYRSLFGVVTQDTYLFHDTVRRNILYATSNDISEEDMKRAAQTAHAHDFIKDLPEGYSTIVGERGVRFSGGQRQRIALARAIVRNPAILILDEATSALDSESERHVQEAIDALTKGRTIFVIAHRLSTIKRADQILVLNAGRIVQVGSHQELTSQDGLYKHLWSLQSAPVETY